MCSILYQQLEPVRDWRRGSGLRALLLVPAWVLIHCTRLAWMDGNVAAIDFSGHKGRTTRESDSLDWLKNRLQGLHQPSADSSLPFVPNWGDGAHFLASEKNTASGNTSGPASGGSLQERFPSWAQGIGPLGGVQSAFIPFQAPLATKAATPLASSMNDGEAPAVPPPKRIRLFGSWVESPAAESGRNEEPLLGVRQDRFQEQRGGGWEQQLSQLDGEPDRCVGTSLIKGEEREQPRQGVEVEAPVAPLAKNEAFWKEEEGALQVEADPCCEWRISGENERQLPQGRHLVQKPSQGGGAPQPLKRHSSGENGDLAKQKLHFGPDSLLLYGGASDFGAGMMGFFREDAAYLKQKRMPQQPAQRTPEAAQKVDEGSSALVKSGAKKNAEERTVEEADGGWFDLSKETTGGLINIFEEDLRPRRAWPNGATGAGPGANGAAAQRAGGLHIIPFQLTTAGGFAGLEGVTNGRSRPAPQTEVHEQQYGRSSARLDTPMQAPVGARGPKSRADWVAEQAAHELLTLAFAQQVEEEAPPQRLSVEAGRKAASLLESHPSNVSIQFTDSLDPAPSVALISADTSSSEDDQPLARRQGGGATPTKPKRESPHANRLPLGTEGGHLPSVAIGLPVAGNEAAVEPDDRCNYHSGKAKKGWRCKNPKLKGFQICVFHRKQRLDRRQMSVAASGSAKPSPKVGAPSPSIEQLPKLSPSNAIPRPPKKRPHAYLDVSPGGSQPSPEEFDKSPPRRKRRSLPKPRTRLGSNTIQGGGQAIEVTDPSRKRGGSQTAEIMEGGSKVKEDVHGDEHAAEGVSGGGLPSPLGTELADEERCTYRSGAQGKWRCKRPRHANFKFCQFHRESQKKYWDKKNQARRMVDKKKS